MPNCRLFLCWIIGGAAVSQTGGSSFVIFIIPFWIALVKKFWLFSFAEIDKKLQICYAETGKWGTCEKSKRRAVASLTDKTGKGSYISNKKWVPLFGKVRSALGREGTFMTEVVTWSTLFQFVTAVASVIGVVIAILNFQHNHHNKKK